MTNTLSVTAPASTSTLDDAPRTWGSRCAPLLLA